MKKNVVLFFLYSFLVSLCIFVVLSYYYMFHPLYSPAEYWVSGMYDIKDRYSKNIDGNKILIVSGSNSIFGICSEILEKNTGMPVLNMACHYQLPLEFYFEKIKQYTSPGDIIVMPLEFDFFFRKDNVRDWEITQFSTWASGYRNIFSFEKQFKIFVGSIRDYPRRFIRYIFGENKDVFTYGHTKGDNGEKILSKEAYKAELSNRYGEFCVDVNKFTGDASYEIDKNISAHFVKEILKIADYARSIKATLLLTFPVSLKNSFFDAQNHVVAMKIDNLRSSIEKLGITYIGNPLYYNMEREFFYNTKYHLNAKGAILRTLFLADDIKYFLATNRSVRKFDIKYFEDKKVESNNILMEFRERGYIISGK